MDRKPSMTQAGARTIVRRATSPAGGPQQPPRVSAMGSLLTLVMVSSLAVIVTAMVFLSNVNGRLQVQAQQKTHEFEELLRGALAELDVTMPMVVGGCSASGLEVLTQQSLKSRILDQIHLRDSQTGKVCSPILTSQPGVTAWYDSAQLQLKNALSTVSLTASEHGLLLARESATGDTLIGEIRTGDLHLHLGDAIVDGYRTIIRRLDSSILYDSAGLYRPGSQETVSSGLSGQSVQSLIDSIRTQSTSQTYPIGVEVAPTPMTLLKTGARYILTAISLAVVFTLALISVFNHYLVKRISVERRLRIALNRRNFVPVIQPIVDAQTGRCKGGEVLMRWDHPARGLVSPVEFLPVAERLGLMGAMTMIIMEKASQSLSKLSREHPQLYFSFNVDASQLRDPLFPEQLAAIFHDGSLPPHRVLLEIVEREAVDEQAHVGLDRLRNAGYRIAIDDFGTGQSSLGLLLEIGFDVLKIDRSFVSAVDGNQVNRPVLDAIIDMAQKLDVTTVAEGVETAEQHAFLVAKGVEAIQGYLMSKPMPVADFPKWVHQSKHRPAAYSDSDDKGSSKTLKHPAQLPASADVDEGEHAAAQEAAAGVRQLRRIEEHSASQAFRLQRASALLSESTLTDANGLAFDSLAVSTRKPYLMPV